MTAFALLTARIVRRGLTDLAFAMVVPISGLVGLTFLLRDVIATGQIRYGESATYGLTSPLAPVGVRVHSLGLIGLTPATTYHFAVVSANGVGPTTSPDFTFTTSS